jgi:hypothetical protein
LASRYLDLQALRAQSRSNSSLSKKARSKEDIGYLAYRATRVVLKYELPNKSK